MGKLDEDKVPCQRIKISPLCQKSDSRLTYHITYHISHITFLLFRKHTSGALLADGAIWLTFTLGYRILLSVLEYSFDLKGQSLLYRSVQS